jgi:tetratricopeptide (TPR) repeat protein
VLNVEGLLARLDYRLPVLTGGARDVPERHQTLRAAIGWSYDLLEPLERDLFECLALFAGGWTLEAAETVCRADLDRVQSLVEKSLIRSDGERFSMLETIREYALERFDKREDADRVRLRHADYFLLLAEARARRERGEGEWFRLLEAEHGNLQVALTYFTAPHAEKLARLAIALALFWRMRGQLNEAERWLDEALARSDQGALRAELLSWGSSIARKHGRYERARTYAAESLHLYERMNDDAGVCAATIELGVLMTELGDLCLARELLARGVRLSLEVCDSGARARALLNLGIASSIAGDDVGAQPLLRESLELARAHGIDTIERHSLMAASVSARRQGEYRRSRDLIKEALALSGRLGSREGVAECLNNLAPIVVRTAKRADAAILLGAEAALRNETGLRDAPILEERRDEILRDVRSRLGDRFQPAWESGETMSYEQALEFAFRTVE